MWICCSVGEFYQLARAHLTDDGMLLQWVQKYAIDPKTFAILMNTVRSEFPNCCVYQGKPGDLLVLASKRSLTMADQERAETTLAGNPAVRASLAEIGVHSFAKLRQRERMGLLLVADQLKSAGLETLDRPRVNYLAGRARLPSAQGWSSARDPSAPDSVIFSSAVFEQTMRMRMQTNPPSFACLPLMADTFLDRRARRRSACRRECYCRERSLG